MRVLSVASECVPFVKTGGLADVVGALPLAMGGQGVEMRVLLPGYPQVMAALGKTREVMEDGRCSAGRGGSCRAGRRGSTFWCWRPTTSSAATARPISAPMAEDWDDNPERFAALSWIAARIAEEGRERQGSGWRPDICMAMTGRRASRPIT
jgi:starch synthase